MKYDHLLLLTVGCGFQSPAGKPDGALPVPDGGVPGMWTFDSAAEFKVPGYVAKDMTIEARGSLTPNAYVYGGLVAHGLQGTKLWTRGDTSWTKLDGKKPTGAGLWCGEQLLSTNSLAYLGITDQNAMTIWFEGEVWLDAGSNETFAINGDDVAFVAIAQPGTTSYVQLTDNNTTVSVPTPVTGWYPIRLGYGNMGNGGSNFDFTHSDSTGGTAIPWTRDRLRARASELSGTLRTVFNRQILGGGVGSALPVAHFEERELLIQTDFNPVPQGTTTNDDWSARYLGQVYVDQPGSYTLAITSDDGNRGRLGAMYGESNWARGSGTGNAITTVPATLTAGWNDVAVDYNQVAGMRKLGVKLSGPGSGTPVEVPRDRLRPVGPADDRFAFGSDETSHPIVDGAGPGGAGSATMTFTGYSGETVTSIDVTYELATPRTNEIRIDLEAPGTPSTRRTISNTGVNGVGQITLSPGLAVPVGDVLGGSATGDWKLHVYDVTANGGASTLTKAKLTLHTTGGPEKIAKTASWTSPVLDAQTNVIAIDSVTWDERLPASATLGIFVRACQQADCSDGVWPTAPVTKSTAFAIGPARYLQLRVDMTSNGTLEPELKSLSVMYRRES